MARDASRAISCPRTAQDFNEQHEFELGRHPVTSHLSAAGGRAGRGPLGETSTPRIYLGGQQSGVNAELSPPMCAQLLQGRGVESVGG